MKYQNKNILKEIVRMKSLKKRNCTEKSQDEDSSVGKLSVSKTIIMLVNHQYNIVIMSTDTKTTLQ